MLDVEVPTNDKLQEWYLEIHDVETGTLVTALEILSPTNKIHAEGRKEYIKKRRVLNSMTNLVEIDLLRSGQAMPLNRNRPHRLPGPRPSGSDAHEGKASPSASASRFRRYRSPFCRGTRNPRWISVRCCTRSTTGHGLTCA